LQTAKNLPRAASVDFLFVRRECSLAGTIFSSGFIVNQPDLLENDSLRPEIGASGGISLARNLYAEALFKGVAPVSGCACLSTTSMSRCCDLCTKSFCFRVLDALTEVETPGRCQIV
jgi:hypothetical protein